MPPKLCRKDPVCIHRPRSFQLGTNLEYFISQEHFEVGLAKRHGCDDPLCSHCFMGIFGIDKTQPALRPI
jgi:hypothetical protein